MWCIATWRRPTPCQSFSTLITTPILKFKSIDLYVPVLWRVSADRWRYAVTLTSDPMTLTPCAHWSWTFVVYRLWRDRTLYHIWVKSNNPQRSYCDFSIWPDDFAHVSRVAQRSEIIFRKFKLSQPCIRS